RQERRKEGMPSGMLKNMEKMQINLKCKPNVLEIFTYFMYHSFTGISGVVRLGISIMFMAVAYATAGQVEWFLTFLLIVVGLLNPVVTPIFLYVRAIAMEKKESTIEYGLGEQEIMVSQNGIRRRLPWASFPLIVWGRRELILYVDGTHALLLPRRQMEDKELEILELLKNLPETCHIRSRRNLRANRGRDVPQR
ncbi:MAG: YcxB family protein, partial [Eubacteriales bacterium]|nr:YcxB family protein [Eubacteriales bacterium]